MCLQSVFIHPFIFETNAISVGFQKSKGPDPCGFSFCFASNTEVLCRSFFSFLPPALRMLLLPEDSASLDDATETGKPSVEWIQDFLRKRCLVTILGSQQVLNRRKFY